MSRQSIKQIMVIGEKKTGKTSLVNYILKNKLPENQYLMSVGVEAGIKTIQFEDNQFAIVQLWDTSGNHQLSKLVCQQYYETSDAFIIMVDLSAEETLATVNYWTKKIIEKKGSDLGYHVAVFANKADVQKHQFGQQQFKKVHSNIKVDGYFEISLKEPQKYGLNPKDVFQKFVKTIYDGSLPRIQINKQGDSNLSSCKCMIM